MASFQGKLPVSAGMAAVLYGFANVTVGDLSPTLLNRNVSAAEKISRLLEG
ncbi:MAG: hypothetical protein ABIQ52_10030 [Vicinamibacterales bacterium]